mgnify:CR=1 FL=1
MPGTGSASPESPVVDSMASNRPCITWSLSQNKKRWIFWIFSDFVIFNMHLEENTIRNSKEEIKVDIPSERVPPFQLKEYH